MKIKKSFLKALFAGVLLLGVAACGATGPKKGDKNWVDYTKDGSVTLGLGYTDKDFYVHGVAQVKLKTAIDGDTAHFTPIIDSTHQGTIKGRFFGIDTPESTGKVQEYGKPASNFTKEILKEADAHGTIVVSSAQNDYGAPNPDSTGSRYVTLIWVNLTKQNAPLNELVSLNLWIVQEGLSWVKNVGDMPQYSDTFYKAEAQAVKYKLNLHSGKPDDTFNYGEYYDTSLLDVKNELAETLADPDHDCIYDNYRMRIQGTVCGYSNHILYLEDFVYYDNENPSLGGEYCGINIFVGMGAISSKYTKLNTYIQVCGLAQYTDNYGFQITDTQGHFPVGSGTSENDAKVIYTAEQNVETEHNLYKFEYTVSELNAIASATPYDLTCLNCYVEVTEQVTCNNAFVSTKGEVSLYFSGTSFNCFVPFNYHGDPDNPSQIWNNESFYEGKTFTIKGVYVYHKTAGGNIQFQIVPSKEADLVWVH